MRFKGFHGLAIMVYKPLYHTPHGGDKKCIVYKIKLEKFIYMLGRF